MTTTRTGRPTGRPPQPTELKVLRGNPGHRPVGTPVGEHPDRIPPPPSQLGKEGRDAWRLYWRYGRPWLAMTDIPTITQLCLVHDRIAAVEAKIAEEGGYFVLNKRTGRSAMHYLWNTLTALRREQRELWSACYMTPTDRARSNVKAATSDPLEEWAARGKR